MHRILTGMDTCKWHCVKNCKQLELAMNRKQNSDIDIKSMRFVGRCIYITRGKTKKIFHSTPGRENLLGFIEK